MSPRIKTLFSLSALYLAASLVDWLFSQLGIPLPWMSLVGGGFNPLGNAFLALLAISGALLFKRVGLSNP